MAAKQNITVAIEPTLLKQARAIAARKSAKAMLKTGFHLQGASMRDRGEVHDRRRIR